MAELEAAVELRAVVDEMRRVAQSMDEFLPVTQQKLTEWADQLDALSGHVLVLSEEALRYIDFRVSGGHWSPEAEVYDRAAKEVIRALSSALSRKQEAS